MRVGFFSDLHLEHRPRDWGLLVRQVFQQAVDEKVDVLVNAGDTHHSEPVRWTLRNEANFRKIPYVSTLGNHDLYGHSMVHDQEILEVSGLTIASTPLWTNFRGSPESEALAKRWISDFSLIRGSEDMTKFHDLSVEFLKSSRADVVIVHFAPHLGSIHPRYERDPLSPYFVNDLEDLILDLKPKLIVHGHIHDPFDYVVGETRIVANPLGYPRETYASDKDYKIRIVEV